MIPDTMQMGDNGDILIPQMESWSPPTSGPCQMTFNQGFIDDAGHTSFIDDSGHTLFIDDNGIIG